MMKQSRADVAVVEAVGLTKVFRDFWMRTKALAVDRIDFTIRPNEIFGLLGPNGSGKSTTIKMILGLLHRSSGRLLVFGRPPDDVMVKKYIGFLPEESYFYRYLNAREMLDYYGKLFGLDRRTRRRRTDELLEMVGLTQVAHRAVGEYSKGMTRRIGLAQALINDPEFLILDEPTSGLDPIGTRQVKDLLVELRRRGKTILLSSHLLADVEDVCDRMVILYGGRIRAEGTAGELLSDLSHTVITTPRLRTETISRIDSVLRDAEGVGIERVEAPRQRLEQLFLEIVERARREQVATSGAMHGGETAAFLRAEETDGRRLIESLVAGEEPPPQAPRPAAPAAAPARPEVIEKLIAKAPQERPAASEKTAPRGTGRPVDDSVIRSLLDPGATDGGPPGPGGGAAEATKKTERP
ncbi:MAG: ABC transporter ATP-binding protein [Phycisphaeraceae bacterium]|nr:ABC transporter ATP-binding protein [Phycisphaeraceae bacterium]